MRFNINSAILSLSISILTCSSAFAESDLCNAKVLHPVSSVENSSSMLGEGSILDSISQFNVDKHTGLREFCQHGGYCYPETITINGKTEKSLKLTNCTIDKKESEDADTEFWSLSVIRSSISSEKLRFSDIENKLSNMGMCNSCADNATQYYIHKPDSKCGILVKSALEGNPDSVNELSGSPDYCNWNY